MKQFVLLIIFFFCFIVRSVVAQKNSIALSYDDVTVGRNINIVYKRMLNDKWTVYGGLKYQLNSQHFKNDYTVYAQYFKEFEANKVGQRMGLKTGLERILYRPNNKVDLFAFADIQFTSANVTSQNIYWHHDTMVYRELAIDGMKSLESILGIGIKIKVNSLLQFKLQTGFGFNYYWSSVKFPNPFHDLSLDGTRRLPLPPSRLISAGFNYNILKSKNKKTNIQTLESNKHFLSLEYNNVQVGRNYSLTYHRQIVPNLNIYGGLKFHLNSKAFVDYTRMQESYYFKQFRAANFAQHWGAKAGLEYAHNLPNTNLALFAFYDLQITKAEIRNLYSIINFSSGYSRASEIGTNRWGSYNPDFATYRICKPATSIENTFGLGMRLGISEKINFRIRGGVGLNYYIRPNAYENYTTTFAGKILEYNNVKFDAPKTELSKMFSMGFEYKL